MKKIAHICMVSEQALPNILPAVFIESIKPDFVYFIVSDEMPTQFKNQQAVISQYKIGSKDFQINNVYSMEEIQTIIDDIKEDADAKGFHLLFNSTGGTKTMAMAAYEKCYNDDIDVFYFEGNGALWLYYKGEEKSALDLKGSLEIENYLTLHGIKLNSNNTKKVPERLSKLAKTWASRAGKLNKLYSTLNYLASKAEANGGKINYSAEKIPDQFEHLLSELENEKLISISGKTIDFISEDNRFFCNGGWLEELVYNELSLMQKDYPQITSVSSSVNIQFTNKATKEVVRNELDIVVIINNQMWVLECKTKKMPRSEDEIKENETQSMIYKLAGTMKSIGGIRTKGVVVSFNEVNDFDKSRADLFDIAVIDGNNLVNLRSQLVQALKLIKK